MSTKVAVISSQAFHLRLSKLAENVKDIELDYYIYEHPSDTPKLLKTVKPCDVLFITGTLPYLYSKPILDKWPIPWTYLKQDEFSVSNTILAMMANHTIPLKRVGIDVMDKRFVENVLEDIEYKGIHPKVFELSEDFDEEALIAKYRNLWAQTAIEFVITSSHNVYKALQESFIPSMTILDSSTSIIRRLEETKALARITRSESAKAVVGIIEMDTLDTRYVQKIAAELHAIRQKRTDNQIEIYTTMGHLQHSFQYDKLESLIEERPSDIKIAFGYGHSINDAEQNALYALQYTILNNVCIVDEQKRLINPLHHDAQQLQLKIDDPYIMKLAKETKLSPLNISKIIAFQDARQTSKFTAHDLAEYLQVTRRTTERILKKLVDQKYVQIVGEEMGYQQGRPRTIYELTFAVYPTI